MGFAAVDQLTHGFPRNKGKREKLLEVLEHLGKNRHRMPYHDLRHDDLDIAAGAGEGAVRNLVRMQLDGPGMDGAEAAPSTCSTCAASCSTANGTSSPRILHLKARFSSPQRRRQLVRITHRRRQLD
jgi:hypothetical protein